MTIATWEVQGPATDITEGNKELGNEKEKVANCYLGNVYEYTSTSS